MKTSKRVLYIACFLAYTAYRTGANTPIGVQQQLLATTAAPSTGGQNVAGGSSDLKVLSTEVSKESTGEGGHERYPVAVIDFVRVQTPFIIGLWIFCAALGKI
ncbi:hypothetical protein SK128_011217, partial [Halocaridina rubra]